MIKLYQMVEKKQLLIVIPCLSRSFFEIRNKLNGYVRTCLLPFCSVRIAFHSITCLSSLFKFEGSIPKYLRSNLIYKFSCSFCNAFFLVKLRNIFLYERRSILYLFHWHGNRLKTLKQTVFMNQNLWLLNSHTHK